jgi:hypothetical protein
MRTTTKRDWLQITLNVAVAGGCIFMAYNAIRYPRQTLTIVLSIVGTMGFIGLLSLAGALPGRIIDRLFPQTWRSDRADRIRLWLLAKPWLAKWFPHLWDQLREGFRRNHCCELSDCWHDPEHTHDGHKICSRHYAEIFEIEAGQLPDRYRR